MARSRSGSGLHEEAPVCTAKSWWYRIKENRWTALEGWRLFFMVGPACQPANCSYSNLSPSSSAESRNFNIRVLMCNNKSN